MPQKYSKVQKDLTGPILHPIIFALVISQRRLLCDKQENKNIFHRLPRQIQKQKERQKQKRHGQKERQRQSQEKHFNWPHLPGQQYSCWLPPAWVECACLPFDGRRIVPCIAACGYIIINNTVFCFLITTLQYNCPSPDLNFCRSWCPGFQNRAAVYLSSRTCRHRFEQSRCTVQAGSTSCARRRCGRCPGGRS